MAERKIEAIVTDIEGTTSALSFVKYVLFPYAQNKLAAFVTQHADMPQIRDILADVRKIENNAHLSTEQCIGILLGWIAQDRKIGPLKTLQGMIWEDGYAQGAFTGHVYEDAVSKLREWHAQGIPLYIYSSGSILAQKLLFSHTAYGDLTPLFSGYFDTGIGSKLSVDSYAAIAATLGKEPGRISFLSDHIGELDAAHEAGYATILLDREGVATEHNHHRRVTSFSSLNLTDAT